MCQKVFLVITYDITIQVCTSEVFPLRIDSPFGNARARVTPIEYIGGLKRSEYHAKIATILKVVFSIIFYYMVD